MDKSVMLKVRVESILKAKWAQTSKKGGKTLSEWVRDSLTIACSGVGPCPSGVDPVVWGSFLERLGSISASDRSDRLCRMLDLDRPTPPGQPDPRYIGGCQNLLGPFGEEQVDDGPVLVRGRELDQTHKMFRRGRGPTEDLGPGEPSEGEGGVVRSPGRGVPADEVTLADLRSLPLVESVEPELRSRGGY